MKTCSRCECEKPFDLFPKSATCRDGRRSYCKACQKKYKDSHRATYIAQHNAACAQWAKRNATKVTATKRASNAKRRADGKDAAAKRAWRNSNKDVARATVNSRRSKLRQAMPPWVDKAAIRAIYLQAAQEGLTVDHAIPLVHPDVCGLHVPWNLVLMPAADNYAKGNRFGSVK